ncbi:MAG: GTP-binding protein [Planctomycetota bacterium]
MDAATSRSEGAPPGAEPGPRPSLRNVGICAHIDAGKTTLTERVLHLTGRERHVGRVDEGTSVMDWMSEERERGITITAAATRVPWRGCEINLVDTPGHVDFTVEVERCMRVLDGAIVVVDATKGVEPQTETVWRQVEARELPAIAFANKCERPGADVLGCAESLRERLGVRPLVVGYPIGGGDTEAPLDGVVDLVNRTAWRVGADGVQRERDIPAEIADEVDVLRAELVDALSDLDETMFAIVCDGRTPTPEEIERSLTVLVRAREVVPLFCGAALLGHGVPRLLDGVAALLPAPGDAEPPQLFDAETGAVAHTALPEPLALAFKVHSKLRRGQRSDLTFVRLYAGRIEKGSRVWNGRTGVTETIQSVLRIHASDVEHIGEAHGGDVVALAGLKTTGTGDTLTVEGARVRLEPPRVPNPVLGVVVEPVRDEDRLALRDALEQLAREDPSLRTAEDPGTGQWVLEGMGELHLEIALARVGDEFGVTPRVGPPRVAFRESIRAAARGMGEVDRSYGDAWGNATVEVRVEPLDDGAADVDVAVDPDARAEHPGSGGGLDAESARAVSAALRVEATSGPLAGHPLSGGRIVVAAARTTAQEGLEAAWVQAAVAALRDALRAAASSGDVVLLEPRMAFVVESPVDVASGVIGDLNSRHATMEEILSTGTDGRRIVGTAPLRTLIGYSTDLRSLSKGRATFNMRPGKHAPLAGEDLRQDFPVAR